MNRYLYAISPAAVLALVIHSGCGTVSDDRTPSSLDEEPMAAVAAHPDDSDALLLRDLLSAYVRAVRAGDAGAVEGFLSSELRGRIAQESTPQEPGLARFVEREKNDVEEGLGGTDEQGDGFSILALERDKSGVVAARIAYGGRELPKPMHFVQENGTYKLGVVPAGARNYWVKNSDSVPRQVVCTSNGGMTIYPGAQVTMSCGNTCSGLYPGSTFSTSIATDTCDYHKWTWDVEIVNNVPKCKDHC